MDHETAGQSQNSWDENSREAGARQRTPLREARRTVTQRAYTAKEAAADQLIVTAERLRAEAYRYGDQAAVQQAKQLSRSLERAAVYLHGHTFDQMTGDATQMVQAKPWQAVMIAFLMGVIFARSFKRGQS